MKRKITLFSFSIFCSSFALLCQAGLRANTGQQPYDGSWESLQQMPVPSWFDDGKIGIFIHWGPYSVIGYRKGVRGYSEHVPKLFYSRSKHYYPYMQERWGATPPEFGYKDIIPEFKAENWDPDAWAELFKEVGAHYVVMTAEHHDGWANWDSDLTPWNAVDKGPKRDLVGDLGEALKKQGLKYAPSYHRERHQSFFAKKLYVVDAVPHDDIAEEIKRVPEAASLYGPFGTTKEFVDDYVARWKEIQTKYEPDFLWMDDFPIYTRDGNNVRAGRAKPEVQYFDDQVRLMITDFMNDGAARGAEVYLNNKGGNRNWPDGVGCLEKDNLKLKVIGPKWQSCTTFGTSFGYLEGDTYKSIKDIIHEMVEVIARNGNFLINIGPKADGTIPDPQVERLRAMGDWLKINGAAIYGSRYWKVSEQKDAHLAFTTNGTNLYAIALQKPVAPFTIDATAGWTPDQVNSVKLLGSRAAVDWVMTDAGLKITPPSDLGSSDHAWSFEIATTQAQQSPEVVKANAPGSTLWYPEPADLWKEALPLGNGRMGAMVFGGVDQERLQLNEESLWAGLPFETYPDNFRENLKILQDKVLSGDAGEARAFGRERMTKRPSSFRSYEPLADLNIEFSHPDGFSDYRRDLNLVDGIATVTYNAGGVQYQREVLISAVDDLIAVRLSADRAGAIDVTVGLNREKDMVVTATDSGLLMDGQIVDIAKEDGGFDDNSGGSGPGGAHMKFAGQLVARAINGSIQGEGSQLRIQNADEVILLFTAATDYNVEKLNFDRSIDPVAEVEAILGRAEGKAWATIKADHLSEHRSLMNRVTLDLGGSEREAIPTDERVAAMKAGQADPALIADFFQFGRYLLIGSSRRPGRLPANLQGIWSDKMWADWESDYHLNINLQMNYWPADVTNLSETMGPLVDWFEPLTERGRMSAQILYGADGWLTYHATNVYGRVTGSGSTETSQFINGFLDPLAGAWMAMTLWRHYEFTQDATFLEEKAYPILKGAAEFLLDYLREDTDGYLVIVPSTSPENSFFDPETGKRLRISRGSTYHTTIVRVVFESVVAGSQTLGVDSELRSELELALEKLPPLMIGANGTIQEWIEDYEEVDPQHRHVSHLLGLFPFATIQASDEALFEAARKTLELRGFGGDIGWSNAWKISLFARLKNAEQAHFYADRLVSQNGMPNLMDGYDGGNLFQSDGNFGGTAGVAEMLLQSHADSIELLPALPEAWAIGSVTGLKARGGFVVDLQWQDGELVEVVIHSLAGKPCFVAYEDKRKSIELEAGEKAMLHF